MDGQLVGERKDERKRVRIEILSQEDFWKDLTELHSSSSKCSFAVTVDHILSLPSPTQARYSRDPKKQGRCTVLDTF